MLISALELQSWPNEKFFSWVDDFFAWGKSLPPTMNQSTFNAVQEQLQIVNKEINRRAQNLSAMKSATESHPINQAESKDWADKIKPILPLVYVVCCMVLRDRRRYILSVVSVVDDF